VGYWHFAHSFVRGNWRSEALSSPVLLAKSCHDLDWIRYVMGVPCQAISSFGSLRHFRRENQPAGAAERCLDCQVEPDCPYSARKIYLGRVARGQVGWPVDVLTPDVTAEASRRRCAAAPTAAASMPATTTCWTTRWCRCSSRAAAQPRSAWWPSARPATAAPRSLARAASWVRRPHHPRARLPQRRHGGHRRGALKIAGQLGSHAGGDYGLMDAFVSAVAGNDPSLILSGPQESLESHLMVFAAEQARREGA
jgi:hypothetical protein